MLTQRLERAYSKTILPVLGKFDPLNVVSYRSDPKRHVFAWYHVRSWTSR